MPPTPQKSVNRVNELAESLRASVKARDFDSARAISKELDRADEQLQAFIEAATEARIKHWRMQWQSKRSGLQQEQLVSIAQQMQRGDTRLESVIQRAREVIATADATRASKRHRPVSVLVEYAERIAYSNAAPIGDVALAGARQQQPHPFFDGWGMPAPQQHMLQNATFAKGKPAAIGGELPETAEDAVHAEEDGDPVEAPRFTSVAPISIQGAAVPERISLDLQDSFD